jgi:Flp pilus assembly protein TadG
MDRRWRGHWQPGGLLLDRRIAMSNLIKNQKGAIIVIFALSLIVLIGFAALGTEVGRWYLTKAELSKAVDAAALAGAANISNPTIDVPTLARDFGMENFQAGYLGTPGTGDGLVAFTATVQEGGKLTVTGTTSSLAMLARFFGINQVATASTGVAQKNDVEIMMVLDRSGSMCGSRSKPCSGNNDRTPLEDLKDAARSFIDYYQDTQAEDMIGLVSFATGVRVNYALNHNFYTPIGTAINALSGIGATNIEDALSQAGAQFVDQTPVPAANRKQQYIVFFTDGRPTAFRTTFVRDNSTPYPAVVCVTGNCDSSSDSMYSKMGYTDSENWYDSILSNDPPYPTGDGKPTNTTVCKSGTPQKGYINIKWGSFAAYPVSGLGAEAYKAYCGMGVAADNGPPKIVVTDPNRLNGQNGYICKTARQMAIDHANALKARFVKIYAIGLGNADSAFLSTVASGPDYVEIAPSSSELEAIFRKIAKDIKLRLVQ